MADVKWIKITTDIFDDEKILLIESLPDAYAIIVVWFKLLCLAGKMNNSGVFVMGDKIAYTDKMLSTIFRMKESTVQMALNTFEQFGMIEVVDGVITIPNWGKHQSLEQLEARREYQKEYHREYRKRQKLLADNKCLRKHLHNDDVNSTEEDIEEDKNKNNNISSAYAEIISYLNEKASTSYKPSSNKTQRLIDARLNEGFTVEDFKKVIDNKVKDWMGTDYQQYLRPETLFGTKFEGYLNSKPIGKKKNSFAVNSNQEEVTHSFNDYGINFVN